MTISTQLEIEKIIKDDGNINAYTWLSDTNTLRLFMSDGSVKDLATPTIEMFKKSGK